MGDSVVVVFSTCKSLGIYLVCDSVVVFFSLKQRQIVNILMGDSVVFVFSTCKSVGIPHVRLCVRSLACIFMCLKTWLTTCSVGWTRVLESTWCISVARRSLRDGENMAVVH